MYNPAVVSVGLADHVCHVGLTVGLTVGFTVGLTVGLTVGFRCIIQL